MSNMTTHSPGWAPNPCGARRRRKDRVATILGMIAAAILVLVLTSILWTLLSRGIVGLSASALFKPMGPPGSGGGLANAILGSVIQTTLALAMATPLGLGCGIYLSEYGSRQNRFASCVRFVSDVLMSVPSILASLSLARMLRGDRK